MYINTLIKWKKNQKKKLSEHEKAKQDKIKKKPVPLEYRYSTVSIFKEEHKLRAEQLYGAWGYSIHERFLEEFENLLIKDTHKIIKTKQGEMYKELLNIRLNNRFIWRFRKRKKKRKLSKKYW